MGAQTGDRVMAGLTAAKRGGRQGGRLPVIDTITAALHAGTGKAAMRHNFGVARSMPIDTLARIGCPPPAKA